MTQQLYGVVIDARITEELYYDSEEPRAANVLPITVQEAPYDPRTQTLTIHDAISDIGITRQWIVTDLLADQLQAGLLAALAAHRYDVQNGGITISGHPYRTDQASQFALTGALIAAQVAAGANAPFQIEWKMANGDFVTLSGADVVAAWMTGMAFVQKCFSTEKSVKDTVANFHTVAAILAAFDAGMA